ncbi:hypothetical protein [Mycobacterium sp. 155]|uniref:hypothetical protein n=1 Tax=Mycobacterium sp. 155 TaxID=1157943 RepID=UPI000380FE0A|nr:hypothetical protein [Mycobacterium sp. 155]
MSVVRPEFLRVMPADIGRVGFDGAAILALVRYVTGLPGETNGRKTVDGEIWWRATRDDIGEALGGVHHKSVGRVLRNLKDAGELLAMTPADTFYGDRAQAYRVPDQPLAESADENGSDLPSDESGPPSGRKCPLPSDESGPAAGTNPSDLPTVGELRRHSVGENGAGLAEREPLDVEAMPDPGNAPTAKEFRSEEPPPAGQLAPMGDDGQDDGPVFDGEVVEPLSDPEPPLECQTHRRWAIDRKRPSCHTCGNVRRANQAAHDEWRMRQLRSQFGADVAAEAARDREHRAAELQRRRDCPDCDDAGWLLGDDGLPTDDAIRCTHPHLAGRQAG